MKLLVVVDMQNDFVSGVLGTKEAVEIVENVCNKVSAEKSKGTQIVFTQDTHDQNYLETQEGKNLPVTHCVKNTDGWQIIDELKSFTDGAEIFEKPTFGSMRLADYAKDKGFDEIELIGLCTDICVISNAMLLKAALPEALISVDSSASAGVTPQSHANALEAMKPCQINVL